jgi:hypothetical protein
VPAYGRVSWTLPPPAYGYDIDVRGGASSVEIVAASGA